MTIKLEIVVVLEYFNNPNFSDGKTRFEKRFTNLQLAEAYFNMKRMNDCEYHSTSIHLTTKEATHE